MVLHPLLCLPSRTATIFAFFCAAPLRCETSNESFFFPRVFFSVLTLASRSAALTCILPSTLPECISVCHFNVGEVRRLRSPGLSRRDDNLGLPTARLCPHKHDGKLTHAHTSFSRPPLLFHFYASPFPGSVQVEREKTEERGRRKRKKISLSQMSQINAAKDDNGVTQRGKIEKKKKGELSLKNSLMLSGQRQRGSVEQ